MATVTKTATASKAGRQVVALTVTGPTASRVAVIEVSFPRHAPLRCDAASSGRVMMMKVEAQVNDVATATVTYTSGPAPTVTLAIFDTTAAYPSV